VKVFVCAALAATIVASTCGVGDARPIRRAGAISQQTGWATTGTLALAPKSATDLGTLAPATSLHLVIGLTGNLAGANAMIKQIYTRGSANYHQFLTPAQFTAMFAPSKASANAVVSYLSSFGMKNVTVSANRVLVQADTNAATASSAFNTSIHTFAQSGVPQFANVTPALVPASLAGIVQSVGGLSSFKMSTYARKAPAKVQAMLRSHPMRRHAFAMRRADAAATPPEDCNNLAAAEGLPGLPAAPLPFCYPAVFTPDAYRYAYDDQGDPTNTNTAIADMTEGAVTGAGSLATVASDLSEMEYQNGLPQTQVIVENVGAPSTDTSGQPEWDIDTQAAVGLGGGAKSMTLYNINALSLDLLPVGLAQYADDDNVPVLNLSIGACEVLWYALGEMNTTDFILAQTVLQGQTVTVASGDTGSFCPIPDDPEANGIPAGIPDIGYPASSPYATAVGGTSLLASATDGSYDTEISWYSGDGGMSLFEQQSPWQSLMIGNSLLQQGVSVGNRLVPDVAMAADPYTGLNTIISGVPTAYGGTSLAAPLAEGIYARLQSYFNNKLGNATPLFYLAYQNAGGGLADGILGPVATAPMPNGLAPAVVGGFHDIFAGDNGFYQALPGFDLNTGMGSIDINSLFINFGA
jgi:pseudomonalisin/xanthomonalisin